MADFVKSKSHFKSTFCEKSNPNPNHIRIKSWMSGKFHRLSTVFEYLLGYQKKNPFDFVWNAKVFYSKFRRNLGNAGEIGIFFTKYPEKTSEPYNLICWPGFDIPTFSLHVVSRRAPAGASASSTHRCPVHLLSSGWQTGQNHVWTTLLAGLFGLHQKRRAHYSKLTRRLSEEDNRVVNKKC